MIEKIACYIRVSTDEQKLHGISLDAQIDKLTEYAKTHNLKIVEWYKDEGVSGRKLIKNRPELQRMLHDAKAKKFDRIIFIKLDRFFRSVAEYHECMKYIDPVIWTATEEKYDLTTANGRAFVNMKLTIAELEADQTGERIKLVNEYMVKNGQAIQGSFHQGLGFCVKKIENIKRVVKDPETEYMIVPIIEHYLRYQNKTATCKWAVNTYGIDLRIHSLTNLLTNTKLYGFYRGNPNYCEPYIDKATFDKIQNVISKNIKKPPTNNVYIFTGLIKCPECGNMLTYCLNGQRVFSLRCNVASVYHRCDYKRIRSEKKIEKELLQNFDQYINEYITSVKVSDNKADIDNETVNKRINEVKIEMANSVKSFNKGRMTEAEHDREYEALETELKELEAQLEPYQERDLTVYEDLIKSDWKEIYEALTRENKRAFWRKYIKEIVVDKNGIVDSIIFF